MTLLEGVLMNGHSNVVAESMRAQEQAPAEGRKRITRWGKGAYAGIIAGALFLALEMFLIKATGRGGLWDPVRLSASIAMGNAVVAHERPITSDIMFIGMLVHFLLAIWYAVLLGMLVHTLKTAPAVVGGAVFGLLMYLFHFYVLSAWYPWVVDFRGWIAIVTHVIFGISAAWIYKQLHVRQLMRESGLKETT
jgi:hypothetical protein